MTDLKADTAIIHLTDGAGDVLCPNAPAHAPATVSETEWAAGLDANRGARVCRDCVALAQQGAAAP